MGFEKNSSYNAAWEGRWGIKLSKPAEFKVIFESPPRFHGDGERYYVFEYEEQQINKIKSQSFWRPINENLVYALDDKVTYFKKSVIKINPDKKEKYESLFQNNPIEHGERGLYFYQRKVDGSYCIAVLNVEKKRIYVMLEEAGNTF